MTDIVPNFVDVVRKTARDVLVLYHGNCPDGFGAATAAYAKFGDAATYRAVNYGEPPIRPIEVEGRDVYLLDFAYPKNVLDGLRARARSLRIIDHHKTAQEDLAGYPGATFDMTHSGAVLAWVHFFPGQPVPLLLRYIEDRDLWKWSLEESHEVSLALWAQERLLSVWHALLLDDSSVETLKVAGAAMRQYQKTLVEQMCAQTVWVTIGGHPVPVANASTCFSEVAQELLRRHHLCAPFAGYYFDRADGKRQWGLRSLPSFDCSAIARMYGGGGHAQAAGFTTDSPSKVHSGPCTRRVRIIGDQHHWTECHVESEDGLQLQVRRVVVDIAVERATTAVLTFLDGREEFTELAPSKEPK